MEAEQKYELIPKDFPRQDVQSAVAGLQAKLALVSFQGKYYLPGSSPPELFVRWDMCEDMAQKLAIKAVESKGGKRSHMSEVEILAQYLPRLYATGWGSDEEMKWIIRRMAELLHWPSPQAAVPRPTVA